MKNVLGFAFVVFLAGFGCETVRSMPYNAVVYVDPERKEYYAPICLELPDSVQAALRRQMPLARTHDDSSGVILRTTGLFPTPAAALKQLDLRPNRRCRDAGAFEEEGRSLSGNFLEKLGILPAHRSRWNDNGSWNW